jgi:hypothetical protein
LLFEKSTVMRLISVRVVPCPSCAGPNFHPPRCSIGERLVWLLLVYGRSARYCENETYGGN